MRAFRGLGHRSQRQKCDAGTPAVVRRGTDVFADFVHQRLNKRKETQDMEVVWHVAMCPGKRRAVDKRTSTGAFMDKLAKTKGMRGLSANTHSVWSIVNLGWSRCATGAWSRARPSRNILFALPNLSTVRRTLLKGAQAWVRLQTAKRPPKETN
jgi:IS5 family transposase